MSLFEGSKIRGSSRLAIPSTLVILKFHCNNIHSYLYLPDKQHLLSYLVKLVKLSYYYLINLIINFTHYSYLVQRL